MKNNIFKIRSYKLIKYENTFKGKKSKYELDTNYYIKINPLIKLVKLIRNTIVHPNLYLENFWVSDQWEKLIYEPIDKELELLQYPAMH